MTALLALFIAAAPTTPSPVHVTELPDYQLSAFGALRTAEPYRLADIVNIYNLDSDTWATRTDGGSVTHLPNEAALQVVGLAGGGRTELRTHDQYRYQAGVGQRVLQTVVAGPVDAGQVYQWGLYDDGDGLFYRYSISGLFFGVRSSVDGGVPVDTLYSVAGSRNVENGNIFEMAFQWLGLGAARGWVNGKPAVTVPHAGLLKSVYMKTADLPLSYEARAGAGPATLKVICATVQAEGGSKPPELTFNRRRASSFTLNSNTANVPAIAIRPAYLFQGSANRAQVWPHKVWCFTETQRIRVDAVLNPATLTGAAFTANDSSSSVEYDTTATAYTGGIQVGGVGVSAGSSDPILELSDGFGELTRKLRRRAFTTASGTTALTSDLDTLVVAVTNPTNQNTVVTCGVQWGEVR